MTPSLTWACRNAAAPLASASAAAAAARCLCSSSCCRNWSRERRQKAGVRVYGEEEWGNSSRKQSLPTACLLYLSLRGSSSHCLPPLLIQLTPELLRLQGYAACVFVMRVYVCSDTKDEHSRHDTTQRDMTRRDTTRRHDTTRHDTTRHGTTRHDTTRHGTKRNNTT